MNWKTTQPRELIAELRIGGQVYGKSGKLPRMLTLNKTDLIDDLRKLAEDHPCTWKIGGNPNETGRYAKDRRHVILWLGQ